MKKYEVTEEQYEQLVKTSNDANRLLATATQLIKDLRVRRWVEIGLAFVVGAAGSALVCLCL